MPYKLILLSLAILITGCNKSYLEHVERGAGYDYKPGYPELRLATAGFIDEDNETKIIVSGDVVYGSLIFTGNKRAYEANLTIDIEVREENDYSQSSKESFTEKIVTENNIIESQEVFNFEKEINIPSGEYLIEVTVTDITSGKRTSRKSKAYLPNPEDDEINITEIRILGKDKDSVHSEFSPATTYDIPGKLDSLKFIFQITNNYDEPITVESRLHKFNSDTSISNPMDVTNYSTSSMKHKGIVYHDNEEIQRSRRTLNQSGSVMVEFVYTDLEQGNYRFEVISHDSEGNDIYKARDFGIKSDNYPAIKSPKELASPLYYLMNRKEYNKLMSIEDPDLLKQEIDRFWLSKIKDSRKAKTVISLYYQRVVEANKSFSNFKEGWKTDLGMVYILFGPPWYSEQNLGQIEWAYSYNSTDTENRFFFNQDKMHNDYFPFYHYVLQRNQQQYSLFYQQISDWMSGNILRQNL